MKHLAAEAFVQFDEAKRNELSKLISARLENPVETFSDFVLKLQELGIQKHTFDSFKDEISFFTKDEHVYSVVWEELKTIRKNEHWQLSDALDVSEFKNSIELLDNQKIDALEFHRRMFSAGVVFCYVYLNFE